MSIKILTIVTIDIVCSDTMLKFKRRGDEEMGKRIILANFLQNRI